MNRTQLKRLLLRTGGYRLARAAYEYWKRPDLRRTHQQAVGYFRQLLPANALIFDIGANMGRYTQTFAAIPGRVVAVEPNPECVAEIKAITSSKRVIVVEKAVGRSVGHATLHIADQSPMSTLSDAFIASKKATGVPVNYEKAVDVPITTLDNLIDEHGKPDYIKIDVEGLEYEVLCGLSRPIRYVSFEIHASMPESAEKCFDQLRQLGFDQFAQMDWGNRPTWVGRTHTGVLIDAVRAGGSKDYGDIIARTTHLLDP